MHPRHAEDVAHARRRVGGLQLRVERIVIAEQDGLEDAELIAAHARLRVEVRQAGARRIRQEPQRVSRPVPYPLPAILPHESRVVDAAPPHVALVVESVGVAGRRDAGERRVHEQQVAVTQLRGRGRRLEVEEHLPANRLPVNGLQHLGLHLDAPLTRGGLRRDPHQPVRIGLHHLIGNFRMEVTVGQHDASKHKGRFHHDNPYHAPPVSPDERHRDGRQESGSRDPPEHLASGVGKVTQVGD